MSLMVDQVSSLHSCGISDAITVRGYMSQRAPYRTLGSAYFQKIVKTTTYRALLQRSPL